MTAHTTNLLQEKYQKVYDVPPELVHNVANVNIAGGTEASGSLGSLLPPVSKPLHRGGKLITFKLDKWGFKDDVAKVGSICTHSSCECVHLCNHTTAAGNKHMPSAGHISSQWRALQGIQDAFVTISLVDGKGIVLGRPQDTPTTNNLAGNYVLFNCEV